MSNNGRTDIEIKVPLKNLNNFPKIIEMSLIKCEIDLILTWTAHSIIAQLSKIIELGRVTGRPLETLFSPGMHIVL